MALRKTCSLSYITVDTAAERALALGRGAKLDIKQAYKTAPVHPEDRFLLGDELGGQVVDETLPFGLRSAPFIFSALADTLAWLMRKEGVSFVEHYIDDFITVGRQGSPECQDNLETCEATGMPIWSGRAAHHSGDPPQAEGGVGGKEQESRCDNALGGLLPMLYCNFQQIGV